MSIVVRASYDGLDITDADLLAATVPVAVMHVWIAQLPHPPDGADRVVVMPGAVIVLDGASAFGPAAVSPATYADRLAPRSPRPSTPVRPGRFRRSWPPPSPRPRSHWACHDHDGPSSTVAIAARRRGHGRPALLGDSYIAYRSAAPAVITDDRIDHLGLPQARLYRERLAAGSGYGPAHAATLRELQAGQRARRNAPGGYWIASADPGLRPHAVTLTVPAAGLEWIVLATDGAVDTARHLAPRRLGGHRPLRLGPAVVPPSALPRMGQETDPDGRDLPRAKRHDDKAIAVIGLP